MDDQPMSEVKKILPPQPRGIDRRAETRPGQDWRVNQRHYDFVGTTFDPLTPMQTLARAKWITMNHGFRYIVTPNVDHIVRLWKEPDVFKPLYDASWLSVCDSRILELLAHFNGVPLKAVPGSDLTVQLFDNVIKKSDPVTIIGADDEIVEQVKAKYELETVYHYQPPMGLRHKPEAVAETAAFIHAHPARYIFICVGSPQQEMVAKACLDRGDCIGLGLCVGASLEFLTGRVKRAPLWMQTIRMEWFFRLLSEPKRLWKRYLIEGPKIFWIWAKWSMGKRPKPS